MWASHLTSLDKSIESCTQAGPAQYTGKTSPEMWMMITMMMTMMMTNDDDKWWPKFYKAILYNHIAGNLEQNIPIVKSLI